MRFAFTVVSSPVPPGPCRCPAPCPIPPGWDKAHTDSARPYTLDELEHREDAPHFHAYPDEDGYLQGFYLWRAIRRDGRLNPEESEARMTAIEEILRERMAG